MLHCNFVYGCIKMFQKLVAVNLHNLKLFVKFMLDYLLRLQGIKNNFNASEKNCIFNRKKIIKN